MKKMTDQQLADKLIAEMQELGLSPNEMLEVINMARKKYQAMKNKAPHNRIHDTTLHHGTYDEK